MSVKAAWDTCWESLIFLSGGWNRHSLDLRGPSAEAFTGFGSGVYCLVLETLPFRGNIDEAPITHLSSRSLPAPAIQKALCQLVLVGRYTHTHKLREEWNSPPLLLHPDPVTTVVVALARFSSMSQIAVFKKLFILDWKTWYHLTVYKLYEELIEDKIV